MDDTVEGNDPVAAGSSPAPCAKLYAVVDEGLRPGSKACQAAHALRQYAEAYPFIEGQWWRSSNTLVILECDDLGALWARAQAKGVTGVRFVEPDWCPDGTLTALAFGPDARKLLSNLRTMR